VGVVPSAPTAPTTEPPAAGAPSPSGAAPAPGQPGAAGAAAAPAAAAPGAPSVAAAPPGAAPGAAERPATRDFVPTPELRTIFFDFDEAEIRPDDARILDANAEWLLANPARLLLIEGHCDERGTNEYNLALGDRRAQAAKNYLVSRGVQAARIGTISYGEERPVCWEREESCWHRNRRAHFLVKAE
jgi:peptidoglycan-associated lipoprotein